MYGKGHRPKPLQKHYDQMNEFLNRQKKYEEPMRNGHIEARLLPTAWC